MGWLDLKLSSQSLNIFETMIQFPGMTWLVGWKEMSVKIKTSLGRVKQNIDLKKPCLGGWVERQDMVWGLNRNAPEANPQLIHLGNSHHSANSEAALVIIMVIINLYHHHHHQTTHSLLSLVY